MKLHLGCGQKYLKGYKHVDYSNYDHIDWVKPIYPLDFIKEESVSEIYASHAIAYFDFEEIIKVFMDWKKRLVKGGKLRLSTPDFRKLIGVYSLNDSNIDSIIGPLFGKWSVSESKFIYHKCVYTEKKLKSILSEVGFNDIKSWDSFDYFGTGPTDHDDFSKAVIPHMDFTKGFKISINMIATKTY